MESKIPECARCHQLEQITREMVKELGIDEELVCLGWCSPLLWTSKKRLIGRRNFILTQEQREVYDHAN